MTISYSKKSDMKTHLGVAILPAAIASQTPLVKRNSYLGMIFKQCQGLLVAVDVLTIAPCTFTSCSTYMA